MTLDELLQSIRPLTRVARDRVVLDATALHVTWPLMSVPVIDAHGLVRGEIQVTADVFSIGSPDAPLRVPLSGPGAQALAAKLGMLLPTSRISTLIYNAGTVVLSPQTMKPPQFPYDSSMETTERFLIHNQWIEAQRHGRTGLVVGHKKDVITMSKLAWRKEKVAIFGWFNHKNEPIQPLQQPHDDTYADYSHGIRLVAPTMVLDGKPMLVTDVLQDPATASLLSDEGCLDLAKCCYRPLDCSVSSVVASGPRNLKHGDKGDDVRAWQEQLIALGYSLGKADGDFGPKTLAATRAFQAARHLKVDGVVGPDTRKAAENTSGHPQS